MATDTDREAACKRIAEAMGLESTNVKGYQEWEHCDSYGEKTLKAYPPNFFTDPIAADALMRWLSKTLDITLYLGPDDPPVCHVNRMLKRHPRGYSEADDWKVALAEAAGAAIKEATNAK